MVGRRKLKDSQEEFLKRNAADNMLVMEEKEKPSRGRKKNEGKENMDIEVEDTKPVKVGRGKKRKETVEEEVEDIGEDAVEKEQEVKQGRGRKKTVLQESSSRNTEKDIKPEPSRSRNRSKKAVKAEEETTVQEELVVPAKKGKAPSKRGRSKEVVEEIENTNDNGLDIDDKDIEELESKDDVAIQENIAPVKKPKALAKRGRKKEVAEEIENTNDNGLDNIDDKDVEELESKDNVAIQENIAIVKKPKAPAKRGRKVTNGKDSNKFESNLKEEVVTLENVTAVKKGKTLAKRARRKQETEEPESEDNAKAEVEKETITQESVTPGKRVKPPARRGRMKASTDELENMDCGDKDSEKFNAKEEITVPDNHLPVKRGKKYAAKRGRNEITDEVETNKNDEEESELIEIKLPRGRKKNIEVTPVESFPQKRKRDKPTETSEVLPVISAELKLPSGRNKKAQDTPVESSSQGRKRGKRTERADDPPASPDKVEDDETEKVAPKKGRAGRQKKGKVAEVMDVADEMPSPSSDSSGLVSRRKRKSVSTQKEITSPARILIESTTPSGTPTTRQGSRNRIEKDFLNGTYIVPSSRNIPMAADTTYVVDSPSNHCSLSASSTPCDSLNEISADSPMASPITLDSHPVEEGVEAKKGKVTKIPKFTKFTVKENGTPSRKGLRTPTKVTGTPWQKKKTPHPAQFERVKFSAKKMPDFKKLHQKQFEKMESLPAYKERKTERAKNLMFSPLSKSFFQVSHNSTISVAGKKSALPVRIANANKNASLNKTISACPSKVTTVSSIREKHAEIIKGVRSNKRFMLQLQKRNIQ